MLVFGVDIVKSKGLDGWVFMLDFLFYLFIMIYVDNCELCEEFYIVFVICVFD